MLQISPWSKLITALILVAGILIALPNALTMLPGNVLARFPSWLPHNTVNLGLDLQGGSDMLLQVNVEDGAKAKADGLIGDIRAGFRKAKIPYTDLASRNDTIQVRVTDASRMDEARKIIDGLNPATTSAVLTAGAREYDVSQPAGGMIVLQMTAAYKTQYQQQLVEQSIEVVRRRIDAMGTREPSITKSGDDRILVQVPGVQDSARLQELLGKTAKMTFQLVDETADPNASVVSPEDERVPFLDPKEGPALLLQKRVAVSGDRLTDASGGFDQQTGQPVVNFRFDSVGARQFGEVSTANLRHRFAIVLDKQIITAPVIQSAILGGNGQITGVGTTETANNLSILMRAGALPVPLTILDSRTIGAELGADSIKAGRLSAIAGLGLVALFMFLRYGLFGLFADVALTFNMVLLLAALTLFGATLTLPGIAGIVLTMGMAVDANVLIYERIREEQRNGRSILASIDTGFKRAMATIVDANMTHLIASLILFELGSGPVQGFAVTLGVGIITSFFTAVMVTRLIVVAWLNAARPRKLTI